jgi:glycosyltransferase involved in cell wall biosynthesis
MHRYALIIPALDEAESIGPVLAAVPRQLFTQILVVDNGSRDCTIEAARAAGVEVVEEPRRGYGQASQTGLANLRAEVTAVAFMDADLSDDPTDLAELIERFERNQFELIVGSRILGGPEPGSLTPVQRFGNRLATWLIRKAWGAPFTDLGPMRLVSRAALPQLDLHDPDFGWNVEMQAKAARLGLRVGEVPIRYRRRRLGKSKISGTVVGSVRAGLKILLTIYRCWRAPRTPSFDAMADQHRK